MTPLRTIARLVRRRLEAEVRLLTGRVPRTLGGYCAIGSALLVEELNRRGYAADFVRGMVPTEPYDADHCWVETKRHAVDITACQFGGPKVLIRRLPIRAFVFGRGPQAIDAVNATWGHESPTFWRVKLAIINTLPAA